jgi:hypothetical protein
VDAIAFIYPANEIWKPVVLINQSYNLDKILKTKEVQTRYSGFKRAGLASFLGTLKTKSLEVAVRVLHRKKEMENPWQNCSQWWTRRTRDRPNEV